MAALPSASFLGLPGADGWDPQLALVIGGRRGRQRAFGAAARARAAAQRPRLHAPALADLTGLTGLTPRGAGAAAGAAAGAGAGAAPSALKRAPSFAELLPLGFAPQNVRIDAELLAGAALFGAGWGLTGICPGPAIVNFASGTSSHVALTCAGVLAGMAAFEAATRARARGLCGRAR